VARFPAASRSTWWRGGHVIPMTRRRITRKQIGSRSGHDGPGEPGRVPCALDSHGLDTGIPLRSPTFPGTVRFVDSDSAIPARKRILRTRYALDTRPPLLCHLEIRRRAATQFSQILHEDDKLMSIRSQNARMTQSGLRAGCTNRNSLASTQHHGDKSSDGAWRPGRPLAHTEFLALSLMRYNHDGCDVQPEP
jgi:hypothetical protein